MFGKYSNRVTNQFFIDSLSSHGWKYFEKENLNELFSVMLERCGTAEVPDANLP